MGSVSSPTEITKIGVIGTGVMGSMLTLLLAEHAGVDVYIHDRSEKSMHLTADKARAAGLAKKVHVCYSYEALCQSLAEKKVFFFSLPHGGPGDAVVRTLQPFLSAGDIVIDGSNEDYLVTQKRQAILAPIGAAYVGMGVSGGFSGARNGPSLMPSGDDWALDALMPLLSKIAAKDDEGRPCVTRIGPAGSGHYVKMVHNGIEHGVMSALAEAWGFMDSCLGMQGDEIAEVFDNWNTSGPLRKNFLVGISGPICRTRNSFNAGYLLHEISDAVVQDANNSEGTGVWANLNAVAEHTPAPSLVAAHNLRIVSADVSQREAINRNFAPSKPALISISAQARRAYLNDLHKAVYASVLVCFIQGLDLLSIKSHRENWSLNMPEILRIWREGCIIKSDFITDLFARHYSQTSPSKNQHPLLSTEICEELNNCIASLKRLVISALEADAYVPCLSASLEYAKYVGSVNLPTSFMEAQLDAFGAHGFELRGEHNRDMSKGKRHNAWGSRN